MAFGWLGTFRQGSWQAFRRYVLEERMDVGERLKVIGAELNRIGNVTVRYASSTDDEGVTTITEERVSISISERSALAKLMQVYISQGGNPFDISLFLTPDALVVLDEADPDMAGKEVQPHSGVIAPKSAVYNTGALYEGGYMTLTKYLPARIGGRKEMSDYAVASQVRRARKWVNQGLRFKRNDIEARIIKLCDLKEQLIHEMQDIVWAAAGVTAAQPFLDIDQYDPDLSVASIVSVIDSLFYVMDEDGKADFNTPNEEKLGELPYLLTDLLPDESNTAL